MIFGGYGDITKVVLEARILELIPHAENLNNGTGQYKTWTADYGLRTTDWV